MPKQVVVIIQNHSYHPATCELDVGDEVIWENRDHVAHTATRTQIPTFETGLLRSGDKSSPVTFKHSSRAERIDYVCRPHPGMTGVIVLKADPSA